MTKEAEIKALIKTMAEFVYKNTCFNGDMDDCIELCTDLFNAGYRLPVKHTVISDETICRCCPSNIYCKGGMKSGGCMGDLFRIVAQAQVNKDNEEH